MCVSVNVCERDSEGLFPYPRSCCACVFGFVQAAESALARGLFGNVVGPVKEFTD